MAYILSKISILRRAVYCKNIIFSPFAKVTCVKNYGYFSPVKSDTLTEKRFRLKDNLTDDYKLIYREHNTLRTVITLAYYSACIVLFTGVIIVGYLFIENPPLQEEEVEGIYGNIKFESISSRILAASSSIILPIIFISTVRVMPFRIYYSSSEKLYKAIFIRYIFNKKRSIETFGEGCAVPLFNRFKFIADSLFKINGRTVLLDRDCFAIQNAREKMIYRVK